MSALVGFRVNITIPVFPSDPDCIGSRYMGMVFCHAMGERSWRSCMQLKQNDGESTCSKSSFSFIIFNMKSEKTFTA